ncbi:MAG: type II toxin-antitoxin system HicA family toxin [Candidatus Eremiobacteraeota bacterium]|nr:type II toxin-antitoxin system HicA family toxin [Candidatus Eremiobacteraeota bacterium]
MLQGSLPVVIICDMIDIDKEGSEGGSCINRRALLHRLVRGSLNNVRFSDFSSLIEGFGFTLSRVSGSHHVFSHPDLPEQINLQEVDNEAKPYQIRQFLSLAERYNLTLKE